MRKACGVVGMATRTLSKCWSLLAFVKEKEIVLDFSSG